MHSVAAESLLEPDFLRKLERLAISAKRVRLGHARGERKSKRKGSSVEFADYRDYVQGDDLRHIDWNILGRLDALYLKLFQEQEDLTVNLIVDASKSMQFGSPSKIAFARKAAAAIAYIGLVSNDRVAAEAFGERNVRLAPCSGKASTRKLLEYFAGLEAGGSTNLEAACRAFNIRNRAKGITVILSDFLDEAGFEGGLRRLAQAGSEVYVIHVLAPEEIDPSVTGDLKLLDSETGAHTEISVSPTLLKRYKQNVTGFTEAIRAYCLARGMAYVFAPSDTPFERLTLEMLRRSGLFV
jgi:uncharacterized protein (DUF58 family)